MSDGKKSTAENIVYKAFDLVAERAKDDPDNPGIVEKGARSREMAIITISKQIHQVLADLHDRRILLIHNTEPVQDRPLFRRF